MNTTGIHGVTAIETIKVRPGAELSGWMDLVLRSRNGNTNEITIFADNISKVAQDLYERLGLELDRLDAEKYAPIK